MTFSTLTQSGSGKSIRVENDSICAFVGGLSPAGAAQTMVVTRERVANIYVDGAVGDVVSLLTDWQYVGVLFTQIDGVLQCMIVQGGIDEIIPLGTANSQVVLKDGTTVDVIGTPTAVAAAFATFAPGQVLGSALVNANGTITYANNIEAGAHTTGNYAFSLMAGTCSVFAVMVTMLDGGNFPAVLFAAQQESTSEASVSCRNAADGTTAADQAFYVTIVCIDP